MPVEVPQVLQLQGGSLLQKVGTVLAEKMPITKAMSVGSMASGMLSSLTSGLTGGLGGLLGGGLGGAGGLGGLSSILTNPTSLASGLLQSTLTGLVTQLSGGNPLTSAAVSALQSTVAQATTIANQLTGQQVAPVGSYGPLDLVMHDNSLTTLGAAVPPSVSISVAAGPVLLAPMLTAMQSTVVGYVEQVIGGSLPDASGAEPIQAMAAQVQGVIDASNNAFATMTALVPTLATASAFGAAMFTGTPAMQELVKLIMTAEAATSLQASVFENISLPKPTLVNTDGWGPIDLLTDVMRWITGPAPLTAGDTTIEVV